jgi:hypothetical protein
MPPHRIAVLLEVTPKQTVASALDWPGWCRAAPDEAGALEALASYAGRYAPVAGHGGVSFPAAVAFDVVERVPGGPATAFAAPECRRPFPQITAAAERAPVTPAAARRLATAAWAAFDQIAAVSPAELRKGPRGGGRDRDQIIAHVVGAQTAYARKLGVKRKQPATGDIAAIGELRAAIAAVLGAPSDGSPLVAGGWTTRYAARRIAWHILEHGWEMQDRAESQPVQPAPKSHFGDIRKSFGDIRKSGVQPKRRPASAASAASATSASCRSPSPEAQPHRKANGVVTATPPGHRCGRLGLR